jgi:hypothetical protein
LTGITMNPAVENQCDVRAFLTSIARTFSKKSRQTLSIPAAEYQNGLAPCQMATTLPTKAITPTEYRITPTITMNFGLLKYQ